MEADLSRLDARVGFSHCLLLDLCGSGVLARVMAFRQIV